MRRQGVHVPFVAFVLAGGLGTRLRSVVSDRPKPMALVAGVPFLELLIDSLASKGVRDIVLLTGYQADMIEEHFRNRYADLRVRFSHEHEPLGTGGPVKLAEPYAGDPTLLVNGDTFFDVDLDALYGFHKEKQATVTLSLLRVDDVSRYGVVHIDAQGRIRAFFEKDQGPGGPGLINGGVSLLSLEFIRGLPAGRSFSMEKEIFPALCTSGTMCGLAQPGAFFDIGTPESYHDFEAFVRSQRL
ncbi:MAG: nucleotidyltransferase family protein [Thermodesulfobacteriota bacterium]